MTIYLSSRIGQVSAMPRRRAPSPPSVNVHADRSVRENAVKPDRPGDAPAPGSTRERILAAAERLFAEQGFGGVSMPMIAGASDITAGAIYKHFDSKEDLFFEVVRRTVQSAPTPMAAAEGESDAALLARFVATYTTRRLRRVRQFAVEIHSASVKLPKVRSLLRQSLDHNIEQIRATIVAGQQAGELDAHVDPRLLASAIMVFVMGLSHMETLLPKLVGDPKWCDFIQDRVATLIGAR